MNKLHALLVGINAYHPSSSVSKLQGCENDIRYMQDFLEQHFSTDQRNIVSLLGADATYKNVIDHFGNELLLKAGKGDTVLFAYSGHGSRELAAAEFKKYYPEELQETLVLYDSRSPGGLDLADKELAVLIDRVAQKGAHVVVKLDCCHSGSGTKSAEEFTLGAARQTSDRKTPRALDSYLQGHFSQQGADFYLPSSRHILLAACDRMQKAYETKAHQGFFSFTMKNILEETGGRIAYSDLFTRCQIAMQKVTDQQHPKFEPYGFFNGYDSFLGLGDPSKGSKVYIHYDKNLWRAKMGAMHGLPVDTNNGAAFEVLKDDQIIGKLQSRVVGPQETSLEKPAFEMDTGKVYEGRLITLQKPKAVYLVEGPDDLKEKAHTALEQFESLYFELREDAEKAAYKMVLSDQKLQLFRTADDLHIRTVTGDYWEKMFADAFEKLEHIARWEENLALDNKSSKINREDIKLILEELDNNGAVLRSTSEKEAIVDIYVNENAEHKVPFRINVHNKGDQKSRHCALFYASGKYGFFPVGFNEPVPANAQTIAMEFNNKNERYKFAVNGKRESTDVFKLFISNSPISTEMMKMNAIKVGEEVGPFWRTKGDEPELGGTKDISGGDWGLDDEGEEDPNDWYTITLRVKSVAKEKAVQATETVTLAGGAIKVLPHSSFKADLSMSSVASTSRSIDEIAVIPDLVREYAVEMLQFGTRSLEEAPANMLELSGIEHEADLKETPLKIEVAAGLQMNEDSEDTLLPLTFDGEHLIPIGTVERSEDGNAVVSISEVPDIQETRARGIGKALKLCFLKLVMGKKHVRYLRWVDYSTDKIERREESLKAKVQEANNILLVIHGIIGDTKVIADCMRPAYEDKKFDLVLAFDYENLNTPIDDTAKYLGDMLRDDAGITPESGKKITILAHSMGGLISRYFIENLNGKEIVEHLIMAGTPNHGSAIGKIITYRDYAIPIITFLANLSWGIPYLGKILGVLQKSKIVTVTLGQMAEEHDFIIDLNKTPHPNVRYSIVAGDLYKYMEELAEAKKLMDKALKAGGKLFYGDRPNDIAVGVDFIKAVSNNYVPLPETVEVACHHLNYFIEEVSVKEIYRLIEKT